MSGRPPLTTKTFPSAVSPAASSFLSAAMQPVHRETQPSTHHHLPHTGKTEVRLVSKCAAAEMDAQQRVFIMREESGASASPASPASPAGHSLSLGQLHLRRGITHTNETCPWPIYGG
uniref:Uncharacterized protein n=1 Tax=Knipowitschia caucasica TaxID=637954 RepID=A0AAV2LD51_KNICA